ncbi:cysteine hydrolase family protein [Micrococcoides hystricis]|uniref:Cysteine hydrolase family protein n=1 Tax=Micrococcoides hystricis TaxID=1572761 RepID=A0ABV6P982_9MICC
MTETPLTLDGSKTALLVVHLQPDIVAERTAFGSMFNPQLRERNVLAHTKEAMEAVRQAGGLVITLRIAFKPDYSDLIPSIPLLAMAQGAGCLKDGTAEAEIVEDIKLGSNDLVVTHKRPGPFTGSNLQQTLDAEGITNVVVCGIATNVSVEGAVRQAADLGYSTFVLEDASSAADQVSHDAAIATMGLFAQAISVEDLKTAF